MFGYSQQIQKKMLIETVDIELMHGMENKRI